MKVKTILVSQPEPKVENSPYYDLQQTQKVKIDFRPFIHVENVTTKEIRLQKVDFSSAIRKGIVNSSLKTPINTMSIL